jgi:hypothetical protein
MTAVEAVEQHELLSLPLLERFRSRQAFGDLFPDVNDQGRIAML